MACLINIYQEHQVHLASAKQHTKALMKTSLFDCKAAAIAHTHSYGQHMVTQWSKSRAFQLAHKPILASILLTLDSLKTAGDKRLTSKTKGHLQSRAERSKFSIQFWEEIVAATKRGSCIRLLSLYLQFQVFKLVWHLKLHQKNPFLRKKLVQRQPRSECSV